MCILAPVSTQGVWGFVVDGRAIVSPTDYDCYPSGLGEQFLAWAAEQRSWDDVRERVMGLRIVHPFDDHVVEADVARHGLAARDVGASWDDALQGSAGDPAAALDAGVMTHDPTAAFTPSSVDWGYFYDLDQGMFEVYRGRTDRESGNGRFWREAMGGRRAISLEARWSFQALPDVEEFLALEE